MTIYNETVRRLEEFTDPGEFERLCCDLLTRLGYRGIEPQGVGRKDGGKDALHFANNKKTVIHISLRKDWDKKLEEDLETTRKSGGKFDKFVFVSNRSIPPIRRDKYKKVIISEYGWEPVIYDQEALRVELDSHSLDLRAKYLNIPEEYQSQIDEMINEFIEKRDEISNYLTKSYFKRIILLSIPNNLIDNRMKLFDEKMKFIGDKKKLENVLSRNLPSSDFDSKNTPKSFSTYYIKAVRVSGVFPSLVYDEIFEANLHHDGIIEILFDAGSITVEKRLIAGLLLRFFETIEKLYVGFVADDESVTLAVCFINATKIDYKKDDGNLYNGEANYLIHRTDEKLKTILSEDFLMDFVEILENKVDNFFNVQ